MQNENDWNKKKGTGTILMLHQMRAFPDLMSSVSLAKQWATYCNIFCIYWKGNKRGQHCRQIAFKIASLLWDTIAILGAKFALYMAIGISGKID